MSEFTPVEMVHVRSGLEVLAESALAFNDLAVKGFARKNEGTKEVVDTPTPSDKPTPDASSEPAKVEDVAIVATDTAANPNQRPNTNRR